MPELPDVAVYVEALEQRIVGRRLEAIRLTSPFVLRTALPPVAEAQGKRVLGVRRLGKRIVIELEGELFLVLQVHGRFGRPCPDCGAPVQRIVYADNETNYCANCQTGGTLLADRALSRLLKASWPRSIDDLD